MSDIGCLLMMRGGCICGEREIGLCGCGVESISIDFLFVLHKLFLTQKQMKFLSNYFPLNVRYDVYNVIILQCLWDIITLLIILLSLHLYNKDIC